jgi:ubiquinone biosynthesis protein UbiJ
MPATAAWLASAEALLNRGIQASARAAALTRSLQGTSLQIDIDRITHVRVSAFGSRLSLIATAAGAAQADATNANAANAVISGSLPVLLQLLKGGRDLNGAAGSSAQLRGAQVRGDAEIANRYRELFMLARPDPEEELSRWIGDFPARRLAQFAEGALEAARRVRRIAGENIAEYLQEEGRDLVNNTELEEFLRGVDALRDTADRIEARLLRLEQRVKGAA